MLTIEEAIEIAKATSPSNKVIGLGETDTDFIILLNTGGESYVTVNKDTKAVGKMWFWDFGELVDKGKAKILKREA